MVKSEAYKIWDWSKISISISYIRTISKSLRNDPNMSIEIHNSKRGTSYGWNR